MRARFAPFKAFALEVQRSGFKVPSVIRRPARVLLRRLTAGDTSIAVLRIGRDC
jgi:hypothetical protein